MVSNSRAKVSEPTINYQSFTPKQLAKQLKKLENKMYQHGKDLEFEYAARVRD